MAPRARRHITDSQKTFLWERWQQGESIHQIARLLDRKHSSIRQVLARTGGIRPATRHRSLRALTLAEREEIRGPWRRLDVHCDLSPGGFVEPHPRSAGRFSAMVGATAIERIKRINAPGMKAAAPRSANYASTAYGQTRGFEVATAMVASADCRVAQAALG